MTPILCFDLETVPDVDGLRRLNPDWAQLPDAEVAQRAFEARRERTGGSDFLQHHLHRIVAIGCAFRDDSGFRVRCLGGAEDGEAKLIQDFFRLVDRYTPQLVSWNGGGFDLPVLHYRALKHGIVARRYWETGRDDSSFKWNNYLSRFHERHTDLMDVLSGYQPRAKASLMDMAYLLGLPGKLGFSGAEVWPAYAAGDLEGIRRYCETDVLNTWLVYLRFEHMRGRIDPTELAGEEQRVRELLAASTEPHFAEFLAAWGVPSP